MAFYSCCLFFFSFLLVCLFSWHLHVCTVLSVRVNLSSAPQGQLRSSPTPRPTPTPQPGIQEEQPILDPGSSGPSQPAPGAAPPSPHSVSLGRVHEGGALGSPLLSWMSLVLGSRAWFSGADKARSYLPLPAWSWLTHSARTSPDRCDNEIRR